MSFTRTYQVGGLRIRTTLGLLCRTGEDELRARVVVAAPGALKWHYPRAGFGFQFREG